MTKHVHQQLSEYLDGALPPPQAKAVEKHLSGCSECRELLSELRQVSTMLSGLPRQALPQGFLTRVKSRARAADKPVKGSFFGLPAAMPAPMRAAALALSGLAVMFVAYEGLRDKPSARTGIAVVTDLQSAGEPDEAPPGMASLSDTESVVPVKAEKAARTDARRKEEAKLARQGAARAAKPKLAEPDSAPANKATSASRQTERRVRSGLARAAAGGGAAFGAPMGETIQKQPRHTNEQLHRMLETEKKRMGIRRIVPPSERRVPTAEEWLGIPNLDRQEVRVKAAPPAISGETPARIAPTNLQSRGFHTAGRPAFSPGPDGSGASAFQAAAAWDGSLGISTLPASVARSQAELDALWARHKLSGDKPVVDFARQMVVLVPEHEGESYDIVSVRQSDKSILVLCTKRAEEVSGPSFRVVPLSVLPLRAQALP